MLDAVSSVKKVEPKQDTQSWAARAIDGFLDSGKEAIKHPGDTALKVGAGLAAGGLLQATLNNVEHCGGKIGTAAKVVKLGLIAVPASLAAYDIVTSDDSAKATGKAIFETGLFIGAAKLGTSADRIPGLGKAFGPRAMTELPATVKGEQIGYQVFGDQVRVKFPAQYDVSLPAQVRLGNGKGFVLNDRADQVKLIDMPTEIKGLGSLEYGKASTTLHTDSGIFKRELALRATSTKDADGSIVTSYNGKGLAVERPNGDDVVFLADGKIAVNQGTYESGRRWDFKPNGEVDMRSLPAGKYKIHADADGEATYSYTHGTSRSIRGMIASSRYKPLQIDQSKVPFDREAGTIGRFQLPNITAVSETLAANLNKAKLAMDAIYKAN